MSDETKRVPVEPTALKPCPCGAIPPRLSIQDGGTFRWKQIAGCCCQEWWVEARINDGDPDIDELAIEAWNAALRAAAPPDDELARLEREIAEEHARKSFTNMASSGRDAQWIDLGFWGNPFSKKRLRYLELRNLLERHPDNPNLVRIKERE